jgi:uncharacterized protein CbrC (UPF0167 family)
MTWQGDLGDIEGDEIDGFERDCERRQRNKYLGQRYSELLVKTPLCEACWADHAGANPHKRCFTCECKAGTLPIYAHTLKNYGREK